MDKYQAQARFLGFSVGEEFESADVDRWAPYVDAGYLVIVAEGRSEAIPDVPPYSVPPDADRS